MLTTCEHTTHQSHPVQYPPQLIMATISYFIKVVSLEYLEFSDDNATAISAFSVGIMGESSFSSFLMWRLG